MSIQIHTYIHSIQIHIYIDPDSFIVSDVSVFRPFFVFLPFFPSDDFYGAEIVGKTGGPTSLICDFEMRRFVEVRPHRRRVQDCN